MTVFFAIVLAGGRSSRMGQDKALLPIGQKTLLQQTCHIAATCCDRVYVVTPFAESYRAHLPGKVSIIEEVALPEQQRLHQGPLVGLLQGMTTLVNRAGVDLDTLRQTWILALACDLPNLSPAVLNNWQLLVNLQPTSIVACLPRRQGRWEPLCGFYRLTCQASMQTYADHGGRSFQQWLCHQSVGQLPLDDGTMLLNLNTPEDWQRWRDNQRPKS